MIFTKVYIIIAMLLMGLCTFGVIKQGFGKLDEWYDTDREMVGGLLFLVDIVICVGLFLYWMGW